ncbi:hypothetical protein VCHA29O37_460002 [Vibrio chagasii]|nr:hypothetical protein VCHA29O37_460002 [Vibrio chagasii]
MDPLNKNPLCLNLITKQGLAGGKPFSISGSLQTDRATFP